MPTLSHQNNTRDSGYSSSNDLYSSSESSYSSRQSEIILISRLQHAIKQGVYSTLKDMVKNGNFTQKELDSGLTFALENGYANKKILKLLFKHGANPQETDQINILKVVIEGNHIGMFKKLLDHRYGVFKQENLNRSIHLLAEHGRIKMAKLLDKRANFAYQNEERNTPLHTAIRYDKKDMAKFFLKHAPDTQFIFNKKGASPLHIAASYGNLNLTRLLLKSKKQYKSTVSYQLAKLSDKVFKSSFFSTKRMPHLMTSPTYNNGNTPLHLAAESGNEKLFSFLSRQCNPDLLEKRNGNGLTASEIIRLKQQAFESMHTSQDRPTDALKAEPIYEEIPEQLYANVAPVTPSR